MRLTNAIALHHRRILYHFVVLDECMTMTVLNRCYVAIIQCKLLKISIPVLFLNGTDWSSEKQLSGFSWLYPVFIPSITIATRHNASIATTCNGHHYRYALMILSDRTLIKSGA